MRLDQYLFTIGKFVSRNKAAEAVKRGEVKVDGKVANKPSADISPNSTIEISDFNSFVSNGGYKLEKALNEFKVEVSGLTFVDIGASTGGFTDCLLRRGAKKVFAVDVGESQLSEVLSSDCRVKVMDRVNARNLSKKDFDECIDGIVCDVSFISLTYILNPISDILKDGGFAITLIKPQFECGSSALNRQGIVRDAKNRLAAVKKVYDFGISIGLTPINFTAAPIRDGKNTEYLIMWEKGNAKALDFEFIKKTV